MNNSRRSSLADHGGCSQAKRTAKVKIDLVIELETQQLVIFWVNRELLRTL